MKKLASLVAVLGLTGVLVTASFAQAAGPKGGPPTTGNGQEQKPGDGKRGPLGPVREALQKLDLNPEQKKKIASLQSDMQKNQKALREDVKAGKVDKKDVRDKNMKLMKDFMDGVKGVLTTEQWKKVEAVMPKAAAGKGKKKGGIGL